LLGILNSKFSTFWFNTAFLNTDTLFPHIQKNQLNAIPINFSSITQIKMNKLVEQVIEKKNKNENTSDLETQIDNLVYRLYDLTYDEVKVIDLEFTLSEKEYTSISLD
jgi:hypothetical protein